MSARHWTREESECGSAVVGYKVKIFTRATAKETRRLMQRVTGKHFKIYRCTFCNFLHLGEMNPRRLRGALKGY